MFKNPETTIWKITSEGKTLIKTKTGIPSPAPKQGESVYDNELGNAICTGIKCSGSGNNILEVELTIK